jgi:hypothetical protein
MLFDAGPMHRPHKHRAKLVVTTAFTLLATAAAVAGGVPKQTFPRLAGYQIGATPFDGYEDPAYHRQMAKLDLVVIGSSQESANDTAAAIRKLSPNTILLKYTSLQSISSTWPGYWEEKRQKAAAERGPNQSNAHDWYARDYQGRHVSNFPNNWTVNITRYVKPDANGDRYPEWAAKLDYRWWIKNSQWDGVYEDSVNWRPRSPSSGAAIDWSGGTEQNTQTINSEFRKGHLAYWTEMRRLAPGKYIVVNHDWYLSEYPNALGRWALPEYDKKVDGGLLERVMRSEDLKGKPKTPWDQTIRNYRRSMDYFLNPDLTIFVAEGEDDNYRFLRYSLATCLLNDGYFEYAPLGRHQYGTVTWFDEFDLAGTAGTDWLGRAIDSPPKSAWKSGVWRRDFEGGMALVNPRGNGAKTISIEDGFRRIQGKQDRQVNNGQPVSKITLKDGDGIILVREGVFKAPAKPKPPVLGEG